MEKILFILKVFVYSVILLYLLLCIIAYFVQDKLIFHPEKLPQDYIFRFSQPFQELQFTQTDGIVLHALWFKSASKGLIFYLHGNAGSLASWGEVARVYTDLGYDVLLLDYRGYGKSQGYIKNLNQLFSDVRFVYQSMLKHYTENQIIVLGYSLGSGLAARVASEHQPKMLILQAPYYNFKDLMKRLVPFLPTFILKYPIMTHEYIKSCAMPIIIFHGTQDEVIDYDASLQLKKHLKPTDKHIPLEGERHNGMSNLIEYREHLRQLL